MAISPQRIVTWQQGEAVTQLRLSLSVGLQEARPFPRIDIVLDLDRFDGIAEHLFLHLTIGLSEAVMLPLVFRPRVDLEALQVCIRCFCIDEDPPAYCAIRGDGCAGICELDAETRELFGGR